MKTFYTLTDVDTEHTNSRSRRYDDKASAIAGAEARINAGSTKAVVIMQAIELVRRAPTPVEVVPIEPNSPDE
jgi:hypothetical protein